MIEIDGSAGGGQVVRTALSLSAITGEAFRMTEVRGGRSTPGLRPQHLAGVRLLADVADAEVSGATVGSEELEFRPSGLHPGEYAVDIGTAGSVALVFDSVLPLALDPGLCGPLAVTARGGTDVAWSPTMPYYRRVKLPLLRRAGVHVALDLDRTGFYPAGGGEATLRLAPGAPPPLSLVDRGDLEGARVYSKASADLADREVAERQATAVAEGLADAGIEVCERITAGVETACPGSVVGVRLDYDGSLAGFDALGERGTPAETVGERAANAATAFHAGSAPVNRHMADQVVPLLAVVGGRVRIPEVTDHVETVREVVRAFGRPVALERTDGGPVLARTA